MIHRIALAGVATGAAGILLGAALGGTMGAALGAAGAVAMPVALAALGAARHDALGRTGLGLLALLVLLAGSSFALLF